MTKPYQGCPGYIVELAPGGPWLTQDLMATPHWDERGIWSTEAEAEKALETSFKPASEQ